MLRRTSLLFLFLLCWATSLQAQLLLSLRDDIRTLRCEVNGQLHPLPILPLGSGEQMVVSFDQMSHDYHRFYYRVEHCDAQWRPTEGVFDSEVLSANQPEVLIEQYQPSRNTSTLYTHYAFTFPNAEVRPLLSGNYRLSIFDDAAPDAGPVAQVCLAVVDPQVAMAAELTTNTDVDWNRAHQQLSLKVDATRLNARDPANDLQLVVLQNGQWLSASWLGRPTFLHGAVLTWQHQPELIFAAGNEYRSFEWLSTQGTGMRVDHVGWHPPYWHTTLMLDEPRRNYLKVFDRNGTSVVRNVDNHDNDTESEYAYVHFAIATPELPDAEVYVDGAWVNRPFSDEYLATYNPETQAYEAAIFLKQGYYNYRYLVATKAEKRPLTAPLEGDFYQTTNDYTVLVYYQSPTDRHQQLVGVHQLRY